ncbi:MAG: prepilin-type N-terminal cleavage/methylation domain-containing protein [Planctomycetota bacterium]|nr:prepilin-type N-terminal cleavage/methylation domain-containing protein [Planctomycetota bacterium]
MKCKAENLKLKAESRKLKAFSLVELMISIAILGIGLTMAAALFAAAINRNESSVDDAIGTIICENGLAVAKARLVNGDLAVGNLSIASQLTEPDLAYPVPRTPAGSYPDDWNGSRPSSPRGCLVIGRRLDSTRNDYQLIVVSYAKIDSANTVETETLTSSIGDNDENFTITGILEADCLKLLGSPVIDTDSGRFATITGVSGTTAYLDHAIGEAANGPIVIVEKNGGSIVGTRSPAMSVLVTRTGLRE